MWDRQIPYIAYESEMARHERTIKRLLVALVISVVLLFASNVAWLWFFNQFDYASDMVSLDSSEEGNANYMGAGASGVIDNGRGKSQDD